MERLTKRENIVLVSVLFNRQQKKKKRLSQRKKEKRKKKDKDKTWKMLIWQVTANQQLASHLGVATGVINRLQSKTFLTVLKFSNSLKYNKPVVFMYIVYLLMTVLTVGNYW